MKKTGIVSLFVLLLAILLSTVPTTSQAQQAQPLVVAVDGVNVNLDWSAMPAAPSYTLYYAFADYKGEIDVNSIGSFEMGSQKNLYVAGLPSGLIIFVAILAHTSQGDVLSNIEKFMGFAGTVTFPAAGAVLMKVDDPGGIGEVTISGTRDAGGTVTAITEIAYTGQSGSLVIKIKDGKPDTITQDNITTRFVYQADGSIAFATLPANAASLSSLASLAVVDDGSICDRYVNRAAYERALPDDYTFGQEVRNKLRELQYPQIFYNNLMDFTWYASLVAFHYSVDSEVVRAKINLIFDYFRLVFESIGSLIGEMIEEKLDEYDRLCGGGCELRVLAKSIQVYLPGQGYVDLVPFCPNFAGARRIDHGRTQSYILNGHYVGPFTTWQSSDREQVSSIACYDLNGAKSWLISFNDNDDGKAKYFARYNSGENIPYQEYLFYANGCLKYTKDPGHSYYYSEKGILLEECDFQQQKCTKYEGWVPMY